MKDSVLGVMLRLLPRNHLSAATGWLVHQRLPGKLGPWSVRWFARRYRIRLDEAARAIEEYPTIGALFTRELKAGLRPLGDAFVLHPCDARLTQFGEIGPAGLIQAKGKTYSPGDLLGDADLAARLEGGRYATYYLCPTDYHRVHSPVTGNIFRARHIPGTLWPVNAWSVSHVPGLFTVNERVVTWIETARGWVAVVMIGATNVGKIAMDYDSTLVTNQGRERASEQAREYQPPLALRQGDLLGTFHMGSTVVVLYEKGVLAGETRGAVGDVTRVGEVLSR